VPLAGDVADDLARIGETNLGDLRRAEFGFFGVVV